MKHDLKVGDRVEWNASCDPSVRTVYRGTVIALTSDGLVQIRDDGWNAISSVRPSRVRRIDS